MVRLGMLTFSLFLSYFPCLIYPRRGEEREKVGYVCVCVYVCVLPVGKEEEEDEEDDGEPEDEDDVKQDRRTAAPRRRAANGAKANGRDSIGNFGNNLTVTGKYPHSRATWAYAY